MKTPIDWFNQELTTVNRPNYINNRILPLSKSSLQAKTYNEILSRAKQKQTKYMIYMMLIGFVLGVFINLIIDFIIL